MTEKKGTDLLHFFILFYMVKNFKKATLKSILLHLITLNHKFLIIGIINFFLFNTVLHVTRSKIFLLRRLGEGRGEGD